MGSVAMMNSNAGKSHLMRTWARQDEIALGRICEGKLTTGYNDYSMGFALDMEEGTVFIRPTSQLSNAQLQKYKPDEEIDFVQWVVSGPSKLEEKFADHVYFDTFTSAIAYAVLIYE